MFFDATLLLALLLSCGEVPGDSGEDSQTPDSGSPLDTSEPEPTVPYGPARYDAGRVHSPLTAYVIDSMWALADNNSERQDDVFAKVGASSTVSGSTLYCFAGDNVDLAAYSDLQPALEAFLQGDAAGDTPFDRDTLAAKSGHSAGWAISGDPSPLQSEYDAITPRFSLVHYGTNDMGLGSTYASAMPGFYDNMMQLIAISAGQGTIPILTGITHRGDRATADLWVSSYNAIIRGMAQAWQIPFIDLYAAMEPLEGYGLAGDGLHLNGYSDGSCIFSEEGLTRGYNVRNLIVLQSLDRIWRSMLLDEGPQDEPQEPLLGEGTRADPIVIDSLPFTDYRDTSLSPSDELDSYNCEPGTDESGPEWLYTFTLQQTTSVRAIVMDQGDVDIDLHLLGDSPDADNCIARGHRFIQTTLDPGTYHVALDSWVGSGGSHEGAYLFALLTCDDGDSSCDP